MVDINHLFKLYHRKRYFKLLREGIAFLLAHQKEAPQGVFVNGSLSLCVSSYYTISLNTDGFIVRTFKTRKDESPKPPEMVPFQECKFENLDVWEFRMSAEMVGELLPLFIPKEQITVSMIVHCRNSAIQARLLNTYGEKEFFSKLNASVIHKDGDSELLRIRLRHPGLELMMVKVVDTTTRQTYLLRVPSEIVTYTGTHIFRGERVQNHPATIPMTTCKQAIAWTFGMKKEEYNPVKES
jgi:hypothetical protein